MHTRMKRTAAVATAIALLAMLLPASAGAASTMITGTVVSEATGMPLLNIAVFTHRNGDVSNLSTVTNAEGRFAINVTPGDHTVWATDGASHYHMYHPVVPTSYNGPWWPVASGSTVGDTIKMSRDPDEHHDVIRLSGSDRYQTACEVATEAYPLWSGVNECVIACGEDAHIVDSLSAAGLAGVLNAPLLLTRKDSIPSRVKGCLGKMSDTLDVYIIGSNAAISDAVMNEIAAMSTVHEVFRVQGVDRYDTACAVAGRMDALDGDGVPHANVLIANGASANSFYDALSLSPIAAKSHYPILLVKPTTPLPEATIEYMFTELSGPRVYIAGGTNVVSEGVRTQLGGAPGDRLSGPNRYATAVAIAAKARSAGWLAGTQPVLAAALPDAVAGGVMAARKNSALMLTRKDSLSTEPWNYMWGEGPIYSYGFILGGSVVVAENVRTQTDWVINNATGTP